MANKNQLGMCMREEPLLTSRLRNCLSTILELEDSLAETHVGPLLSVEFETLKLVMQRLEAIDIREDDVCRIEAATSRFLAELRETFTNVTPSFKVLQ